jgi:hypothetical protein
LLAAEIRIRNALKGAAMFRRKIIRLELVSDRCKKEIARIEEMTRIKNDEEREEKSRKIIESSLEERIAIIEKRSVDIKEKTGC